MQARSFSKTTITLHWIVGLTIIALMAIGWYMKEFKDYGLYNVHKSVGVIIFAVILYRVVYRLIKGFPTPAGTSGALQAFVAKLVHWALLIGTVLFPLSGVMMSGAGGHGVYVFGVELIAKNIDAATGKTAPFNETIAGLGHEIHEFLLWGIGIVLVLHIAGALKHHIIDKDITLKRMIGKA